MDFEYSLLFCAIKRPTIFGCDFRQKFFCTKHVFFVVDRFDRRRMCGKTGVEYTQEVIPIRGVGKIFSIFPGGHQGIFPEEDKSSEICFFPLKTKKQPFFAENFKFQGDQCLPCPPPTADGHDTNLILELSTARIMRGVQLCECRAYSAA